MNPFLLPRDSYTRENPIDLVWTIFDVIPLGREEEYNAAIARLTRGQRIVYAIECYRAEVCNGGHGQFFCNSSGIVWKEALEGLEIIGATEIRELLEKSVALFPNGQPEMDWDKRLAQHDQFDDEKLNDFDEPFYARENLDLTPLINKYVDDHPEEFFESEENM